MSHMNGKGARYTRMHRAQKLVYIEEFPSISEAMKNEKRIKRLSHHQKLELMRNQTKTK
jgi:putative endonuclease